MKNESKVWVVLNSSVNEAEIFSEDKEAFSFCKKISLRNNVFCCIMENSRGRPFAFENGDIANVARREKLFKDVEEMIMHSEEREVAQFRGKRSSKKA